MVIHKSVNEFNHDAIQALKLEIKILREIEHENIIQYIGSEIIESGEFCIYLEYASEGSLVNIYNSFGPLDEFLIRKYVIEILKGLSFLHSQDIVHQDLK